MSTRALLHGRMVGLGIVLLTIAFQGSPSAQQGAAPSVSVGASDLGGVVTSANGPEAGVWVIAETNDLPTKLAKIVVTDDRGRYLIPDLPKASYSVWVRGYGLVDSPKTQTAPGKLLDLTAVVAPKRRGGGGVLPGDLLVFDAEGPGRRASSPARGPTATASTWR